MKFIFKKIKHFYFQKIIFNNSKILIICKARFRRKTVKTRIINNVNLFVRLLILIIKINHNIFYNHS